MSSRTAVPPLRRSVAPTRLRGAAAAVAAVAAVAAAAAAATSSKAVASRRRPPATHTTPVDPSAVSMATPTAASTAAGVVDPTRTAPAAAMPTPHPCDCAPLWACMQATSTPGGCAAAEAALRACMAAEGGGEVTGGA
ncbi:hypothetical protein MMPV_006363 [Pyropia vietnamensis]